MQAMRERRGRRRQQQSAAPPQRALDYHNLRSPFPPMAAFSDDRVAAIHEAALDVLERLGIKVLETEAQRLFAAAGALVDETSQMVRIGREIVEAALRTAPRSFVAKGGAPEKDILIEPGRIIFQPGAGAPNVTDLSRGRRPGSLRDFRELVRLTDHFDVLQMVPTLIEPQDVPTHLRHYEMVKTQIVHSRKVPFFYSRGRKQAEQSFELLKRGRGLSDEAFSANPHCYTIINTNSPRQIDIPMARGLMDFPRAGQMVVVTPFTLMGAMAPITVAGALTLSHAEALAAITLTQLAAPGAPVCYGTFTSNVDMKSGAPAFGTPEHFKASLAAGQLARLVDLPWRSAAGSASNINDVQAANENQFGLWGCLLAGATITLHSAGWLEGGLTVSYEKLVCDVEVLQMIAELCHESAADEAEIAFDAISEVMPGGHFFSTANTMERYQTEFYPPILHDYKNFGTWQEQGELDASRRALQIWQDILDQSASGHCTEEQMDAINRYVTECSAEGGAAPES